MPIDDKVDALTDRLTELSLMIKTSSAVNRESTTGLQHSCNLCKKPGHGPSRCDYNPNRDHRCEKCGKLGHKPVTCWTNPGKPPSRVSFKDVRSDGGQELNLGRVETTVGERVSLIAEMSEDEVVAAVKRGNDGEELPKQTRHSCRPISSMLNQEGDHARMDMTINDTKKSKYKNRRTLRRRVKAETYPLATRSEGMKPYLNSLGHRVVLTFVN